MELNICSQCKSSNIEVNIDCVVCVDCGEVLNEGSFSFEPNIGEQKGKFIGNHSGLSCVYGRHSLHNTTNSILRYLQNEKIIEKELKIMCSNLHIPIACVSEVMVMMSGIQKNWGSGARAKLKSVACLYVVCRKRGLPIAMADVSSLAGLKFCKLAKEYDKLVRNLKDKGLYCPEKDTKNVELAPISPIELIPRFIQDLSLSSQFAHDIEKYSNRLARLACEHWIGVGRNPRVLAAACISVACQAENIADMNVKILCSKLSMSKNTVSQRSKEIKDLLVVIAKTLPCPIEAKPSSVTKYLRQICAFLEMKESISPKANQSISNLANSLSNHDIPIHTNQNCNEETKQAVSITNASPPILPSSFVRNQEKMAELSDRITKAKRRIDSSLEIYMGPKRTKFSDDESHLIDDSLDELDLMIERRLLAGDDENMIKNSTIASTLLNSIKKQNKANREKS